MKEFKFSNKLAKISLIFSSTLLTLLVSSIVVTAASAVYQVNEDSPFVEGDFCYYHITEAGHTNEVAVAWNKAPAETPAELTIDPTVSHGGTTYKVTSLAKYAFRYCDFEKITLPNSIEEIREGAFSYCENLTEFVWPYNSKLTTIPSSCFLDCRAMAKFYYWNADHNKKVRSNDYITTINDHAFNSCVSLVEFNCPSKLVTFGQSCFQKCSNMQSLFFPSYNRDSSAPNNITIEPYAFADCSLLGYIYWEQENMSSVAKHAFVDCKSNLKIHIGTSGTYSDPTNRFTAGWRKRYISSKNTAIIEIETDHKLIFNDNNYPGLRFTLETSPIRLESTKNTDKTTNKPLVLFDPTTNNGTYEDDSHNTQNYPLGAYLKITEWTPSDESIDGYYTIINPDTGLCNLTIPDDMVYNGERYPVRVIDSTAFPRKTILNRVEFNRNLVQIRSNSFKESTNISELDFNNCENLKEIAYQAFGGKDYDTIDKNLQLTSINLPSCLEYIGYGAFMGMQMVNELTFHPDGEESHLKNIGQWAFAYLGAGLTKGNGGIHLKLPKSLRDDLDGLVNMKVSGYKNWNDTDDNWCAVNDAAFYGANAILTAQMETEDDPDIKDDVSIRTSLGPNIFNTCASLIWFKANDNLCCLGADLFKKCEHLYEIFLTTNKTANSGKQFPWGTKDGGNTFDETLFRTTASEKRDCIVIYLDGPDPIPYNGIYDDTDLPKHAWNAETSNDYPHDIYYNPQTDVTKDYTTDDYRHRINRYTVPTYENIDWQNPSSKSLIYWNPSTNAKANAPTTLSDYTKSGTGIIAFAKPKGSNDYTVARYFCSSGKDTIDLSTITYDGTDIAPNLKTIGPEAFGKDSGAHAGKKFILPTSLTTICERAFQRWGSYKTSMVTYKSGGKYVTLTGTSTSVPTAKFCCLPNSVTRIERNAFYNNEFTQVKLGSGVTFLGNGAFYSHTKPKASFGSALTNITFESSDDFMTTADGGVYYSNSDDADHKMLLYQSQKYGSGGNALTIDAGTKAVGMDACANTNYVTINLNNELTNIYGGGFATNLSLTTITGGIGLKYIGAYARVKSEEVYTDELSSKFDNVNYRKVNQPSPLIDGGTVGEGGSIAWSSLKDYLDQTRKIYTVTSDHNTDPVCSAGDRILSNGQEWIVIPQGEEPNLPLSGDQIESNGYCFTTCNKLATFNLKQLTSLKKIGRGAFINCSVLENMVGSDKYTFKKYNGSGFTTVGTAKTSAGVLDLSGCNQLLSIDRQAFFNCDKIKYLILPQRNGQMKVGYDPDYLWPTDPNYENARLMSDTNCYLLVGDKEIVANSRQHKDIKAYPYTSDSNAWYTGSTSNDHPYPYYYCASISDINADGNTSWIRYWTKTVKNIDGVDVDYYILFDNKESAQSFFNNSPTVPN